METIIEYHAPERAKIREYAIELTQELAEREDDPSYAQPEFVQGITDFLQVVTWIEAKRHNEAAGIYGQMSLTTNKNRDTLGVENERQGATNTLPL